MHRALNQGDSNDSLASKKGNYMLVDSQVAENEKKSWPSLLFKDRHAYVGEHKEKSIFLIFQLINYQ
jgi:hypothetical protein